MKRHFYTLIIIAVAFVFAVSMAFAGDVEHGKKLFNDPTLGGSTTPESCNSCHPNGEGLEKAAKKKYGGMMSYGPSSLAEVVNGCIKASLKGKPIDPKGKDMDDIISYIRTFAK